MWLLVKAWRRDWGRGGEAIERARNFKRQNNCGSIEEKRDLAAEHAGFGNHETYRQAEKVCDEGVLELVALMDEDGGRRGAPSRPGAFLLGPFWTR